MAKSLVVIIILLALAVTPIYAQEGTPERTVREAPAVADQPQFTLDGVAIDDPSVTLDGAELHQLDSKLSYLWISPWDMQIAGNYEANYISQGCLYSGAIIRTQINLPEGSKIAAIRSYYHDENPSQSVVASLTRISPGSDAVLLADVVSSDTDRSAVGSKAWAFSEIVKNMPYTYLLTVYSTTNAGLIDQIFCGVRIAYYAPVLPQVYLPITSAAP
ncbi:MAG TPA: hypothetical protein PKD55_11385 [Bellilinea sp.]|nr:hypothetical protein [Bellilinea sp.]